MQLKNKRQHWYQTKSIRRICQGKPCNGQKKKLSHCRRSTPVVDNYVVQPICKWPSGTNSRRLPRGRKVGTGRAVRDFFSCASPWSHSLNLPPGSLQPQRSFKYTSHLYRSNHWNRLNRPYHLNHLNHLNHLLNFKVTLRPAMGGEERQTTSKEKNEIRSPLPSIPLEAAF